LNAFIQQDTPFVVRSR